MVNKTVFLIGMMGSGKSTIGAELAACLDLPFLDLDLAIEKNEGRSITAIFEEFGEAHFRKLEQAFIENLSKQVQVVACGGGLPCFFNNMELLMAKGLVIYLDAKPELLYQRIKEDRLRPILQDAKAFALLKATREATYQKAHLTIDCSQSVKEIVGLILAALATAN
jgi:shikimate kinase